MIFCDEYIILIAHDLVISLVISLGYIWSPFPLESQPSSIIRGNIHELKNAPRFL